MNLNHFLFLSYVSVKEINIKPFYMNPKYAVLPLWQQKADNFVLFITKI